MSLHARLQVCPAVTISGILVNRQTHEVIVGEMNQKVKSKTFSYGNVKGVHHLFAE